MAQLPMHMIQTFPVRGGDMAGFAPPSSRGLRAGNTTDSFIIVVVTITNHAHMYIMYLQ